MAEATSARIELLTAEVRTLMVGSRQVTLSVAKQLDEVAFEEITAFGRIRTGRKPGFAEFNGIEVVGSCDGKLARSWAAQERYVCKRSASGYEGCRIIWGGQEARGLACKSKEWHRDHLWDVADEVLAEWRELPLIVLAGLR